MVNQAFLPLWARELPVVSCDHLTLYISWYEKLITLTLGLNNPYFEAILLETETPCTDLSACSTVTCPRSTMLSGMRFISLKILLFYWSALNMKSRDVVVDYCPATLTTRVSFSAGSAWLWPTIVFCSFRILSHHPQQFSTLKSHSAVCWSKFIPITFNLLWNHHTNQCL